MPAHIENPFAQTLSMSSAWMRLPLRKPCRSATSSSIDWVSGCVFMSLRSSDFSDVVFRCAIRRMVPFRQSQAAGIRTSKSKTCTPVSGSFPAFSRGSFFSHTHPGAAAIEAEVPGIVLDEVPFEIVVSGVPAGASVRVDIEGRQYSATADDAGNRRAGGIGRQRQRPGRARLCIRPGVRHGRAACNAGAGFRCCRRSRRSPSR